MPDTPEAPTTTSDESVEESNAPESAQTGTSSEDQGWESPVNIDELDESLRDTVREIEKQFKGQYTKKTQELASQRKTYEEAQEQLQLLERLQNDPEFQRQVHDQLRTSLGLSDEDVDDDDLSDLFDDDEDEEGESFHDPRVDELLAEREAKRQQDEYDANVQAIEDFVEEQFDAINEELGEGNGLSEEEQDAVIAIAFSLPPDEGNHPRVREAYEKVKALETVWQNRWIDSKNVQPVGNGAPGSKQFDFLNADERLAQMAAIAEANRQ